MLTSLQLTTLLFQHLDFKFVTYTKITGATDVIIPNPSCLKGDENCHLCFDGAGEFIKIEFKKED
jgi:hypothetical protein